METDDTLVRRVLAGDRPAFGDLVDRYRPEAARLARRLLRRPQDAGDAAQVVHESRELHRLVMDAIGALPPEQRVTVERHHVEGLKLWEIAALVAVPVGTVTARLHRARARLRRALVDAVAEMEDAMVEVSVEDVIVRTPSAEPGAWLAMPPNDKLGLMRVVLLKERAGERVLPIWLWPVDGDGIAMRLVDLAFFRPGPHDLIARLLRIGELRVEKVAVTALRENTYYGSLWVHAGGAAHEIDVRPSDAITIALDTGAPIFVTEETFAQAGRMVLRAGDELPGLAAIHRRSVTEGKAEPDDKEFRSFRTLPRSDNKWVTARTARP